MTGEELSAFIKDKHLEDYEIVDFTYTYGMDIQPLEASNIIVIDEEKIVVLA